MKQKARRKKLLKKRISEKRSLRSKSKAKPQVSKSTKSAQWKRAKAIKAGAGWLIGTPGSAWSLASL